MRVLVTGGCGFIGSHLVEALVRDGHTVRVLDDLSTGHEGNLAAVRGNVDLVVGDIRNPADADAACRGMDAVFHEAALVSVFASVERPDENHAINITGTLNMLEAARRQGVRRLVLASSAAVYGDDATVPKTEDMPAQPVSPYALAKWVGESYLELYGRLYGMETAALRYFNVYGPRQDPSSMYSGVISKFVDGSLSGEEPVIFGDGKQSRDFVFVLDVVRANLLALQADVQPGEVFNVATGSETNLLELLAAIGDRVGEKRTPRFEPARVGDVRRSVASIRRAQDRLGYTPHHNMASGLDALVAFERERRHVGT